ncbi:MAG: CDP-alcohol phosphatidyltransferase family protein [Leptospiraceae bacterium]|nr:CDP-alcohol phosphatidyltransferase family protein [Leptospiraceae bacterium]MCK6382513.1 CDP-alcohol phosphatidyltransferase family protein [Leptospiraceae bacterium]NUM41160.1 CDP-alcohol phosphatidyltransferase family protein [Leptospiraceae bacterium]
MKIKLSWIPNTLSLGNLTMGFVSILIASEVTKDGTGNSQIFLLSGFFIILAALFDGFDGMAARALNATSDLGAELDTLADLTTFGIAPGHLMYKMILEDYKMDFYGMPDFLPYGMLVAAIFPICAAYRLARFTVAHDPGSFTGLPSPVAGVLVALFPISFNVSQIPNWISIAGFILVAILMVSTIKYSKPQVAMRGKFSRSKIFIVLTGFIILVFAVGWTKFPWILYGIIIFYVFSGLISFIIHLIQEYKV